MAQILLVCHNLLEREGYKHLITSWGHIVTAVEDGWDCLDALSKTNFNMVILEQETTGITSYEICLKLKQNPQTFPISIIILSRKCDVDLRRRFYKIECDNIVPVPIDTEELHVVIDKLIHAHAENTSTESKLKLIQGAAKLLQDLSSDVEPINFNQAISYAHTLSLKLPYSNYQRQLFLSSIKLCSYYLKHEATSNIITSFDNFIATFAIGEWLIPSLHCVRYNSLNHTLSSADKIDRDVSIYKLKTLGFYPFLQLGSMTMCFQELLDQGISSTKALQRIKDLSYEKNFDMSHIKQLENFIIAEEIFNKL